MKEGRFKTMKVEQILEIEIEDMTGEGQGVGKAEGLVFFVGDTVPGDLAKVQITKVKKNYAFAKLVKLIKPSAYRVSPLCPLAGRCGGCSLQNLSYKGQLKLKEKQVRDKLIRLAGLENPLIKPIIGMETPFKYRNKVQFQLSGVASRIDVGFFQRNSNMVVDYKSCMLLLPPALAAAEALREFVTAYSKDGVSVYDPKSGKGLLRNLVVKVAEGSGEVMVVLVINGTELPKAEVLVELLDEAITGLYPEEDLSFIENANSEPQAYSLESVVLNINKKQTGEIFGEKSKTIGGKGTILDISMGLKFEISPRAFYQVNSRQTEALYGKVLEYADLKGGETILDLYCGVGTIGLLCADRLRAIESLAGSQSGKVIGIESEKTAVIDANRNAVINGIVNAVFYQGKAEDEVGRLISGYTDKDGFPVPPASPDIVILDPPRAGCDPALLEAVSYAAPSKIIYVSCDPATLARDIKLLTGHGYKFIEATPVDMFPWTTHVESIILMTYCGLEGEK